MPGTVENTHGKITEKFRATRDMLVAFRDLMANLEKAGVVKSRGHFRINLMLSELEELEDKYNLCIVHVLGKYYSEEDGENANEHHTTEEYYQIIASENFSAKLGEYVAKGRSFISSIVVAGGVDLAPQDEKPRRRGHPPKKQEMVGTMPVEILRDEVEKMRRLVASADAIDISVEVKKSNYEVCKCGMRMTVIPAKSIVVCENCSKMRALYGLVFDDSQFYTQGEPKTKHGMYNPNRHFKFWMERIQAKENVLIPQQDIDALEYIIERDGMARVNLNCYYMRAMLKEADLTKYNEHTSLLIKKCGGPSPPQLDFNELRVFSIKFNIYMKYLKKIKTDGNRPNYPFWIYKIAEDEFDGKPDKIKILIFIHLQSEETIRKNDEYLKQIVEIADPKYNLKFRQTVKPIYM